MEIKAFHKLAPLGVGDSLFFDFRNTNAHKSQTECCRGLNINLLKV
jgi:hypothetical protein